MEKEVSAADANRQFSSLLREVREGRSFVVTSHGKPVARLTPVGGGSPMAAAARACLLARLERQSVANAGRWSRDELYDDR